MMTTGVPPHCGGRYIPKVAIKHLEDPIITMAIVLLCSPSLIKNPYLTAKLVEVRLSVLAFSLLSSLYFCMFYGNLLK